MNKDLYYHYHYYYYYYYYYYYHGIAKVASDLSLELFAIFELVRALDSESQAKQKGKKKNHLWVFALNHHTLNGVFIFGSSKKRTNFYKF